MPKNNALIVDIIDRVKELTNDGARKKLVQEIVDKIPQLELKDDEKKIVSTFLSKVQQKKNDMFLVKQIHTYLENGKHKELAKEFMDSIVPLNRHAEIESLILKLDEITDENHTKKKIIQIVDKINWLRNDSIQTNEQCIESLEQIKAVIDSLLLSLKPKVEKPKK